MSENPYSSPPKPSVPTKPVAAQIREISIRPLDRFQRGFRLIQDQYWLFLGMTLVAMFIGSAIPMGILLGPMLVGLYLALAQKADQGQTEFGTLFKGFDKFGDSLIAMLIVVGVSLVVMIPLGILAFVGMLALSAGGAAGGAAGGNEAVSALGR
jgi:hypothetical protein